MKQVIFLFGWDIIGSTVKNHAASNDRTKHRATTVTATAATKSFILSLVCSLSTFLNFFFSTLSRYVYTLTTPFQLCWTFHRCYRRIIIISNNHIHSVFTTCSSLSGSRCRYSKLNAYTKYQHTHIAVQWSVYCIRQSTKYGLKNALLHISCRQEKEKSFSRRFLFIQFKRAIQQPRMKPIVQSSTHSVSHCFVNVFFFRFNFFVFLSVIDFNGCVLVPNEINIFFVVISKNCSQTKQAVETNSEPQRSECDKETHIYREAGRAREKDFTPKTKFINVKVNQHQFHVCSLISVHDSVVKWRENETK